MISCSGGVAIKKAWRRKYHGRRGSVASKNKRKKKKSRSMAAIRKFQQPIQFEEKIAKSDPCFCVIKHGQCESEHVD